jgi:rod shape-determining protein MreD
VKNFLILIFILFLLVLLETGFLIHFKIFNYIPNLVLLFVIGFNLFEEKEGRMGIVLAILGGLALDIFSFGFFGLITAVLVVGAIIIKLVLKDLLRFSILK